MGSLGDERAVEPLIACLGDPASHVRRYTVSALEQLGDERVVQPLIACLSYEASVVRDYAIFALKRLRRGGLIAALRNEDRDVRRSAASARAPSNQPMIGTCPPCLSRR